MATVLDPEFHRPIDRRVRRTGSGSIVSVWTGVTDVGLLAVPDGDAVGPQLERFRRELALDPARPTEDAKPDGIVAPPQFRVGDTRWELSEHTTLPGAVAYTVIGCESCLLIVSGPIDRVVARRERFGQEPRPRPPGRRHRRRQTYPRR